MCYDSLHKHLVKNKCCSSPQVYVFDWRFLFYLFSNWGFCLSYLYTYRCTRSLFSIYYLSKNAQVYHKQIVQWGGARKGFISSLKIKFIAKFILHPKIAGNKCLIHLLSCSKLYKLSYIELTKSYIRSIFLGQTMSIKFTMNVSQDKWINYCMSTSVLILDINSSIIIKSQHSWYENPMMLLFYTNITEE